MNYEDKLRTYVIMFMNVMEEMFSACILPKKKDGGEEIEGILWSFCRVLNRDDVLGELPSHACS